MSYLEKVAVRLSETAEEPRAQRGSAEEDRLTGTSSMPKHFKGMNRVAYQQVSSVEVEVEVIKIGFSHHERNGKESRHEEKCDRFFENQIHPTSRGGSFTPPTSPGRK